jgi:hypothetical protein
MTPCESIQIDSWAGFSGEFYLLRNAMDKIALSLSFMEGKKLDAKDAEVLRHKVGEIYIAIEEYQQAEKGAMGTDDIQENSL